MNKINNMIDEIDCISDVRKDFYKKILNNRFKILNELVQTNSENLFEKNI